jgi:hypothetical protein
LLKKTDHPGPPANEEEHAKVAACLCGSAIPVQKLELEGEDVLLIALPLILEQFRAAGKPISTQTGHELLETVKIYNPIPTDLQEQYEQVILQTYSSFCANG